MAARSHNIRIRECPDKSSEKKLKLTVSCVYPVGLIAIRMLEQKNIKKLEQ